MFENLTLTTLICVFVFAFLSTGVVAGITILCLWRQLRHQHHWSKWEPVFRKCLEAPGLLAPAALQGRLFSVTERWQRRTCSTCGLTQEKPINKQAA